MVNIYNFVENIFQPYVKYVNTLQKRVSKYLIRDILHLKLRIVTDYKNSRVNETSRIENIRKMRSGNISYWLNKLNKVNAYDELFVPTIDIPTQIGRPIAADGSVISISLENKNGVAKASLNLCSLLDINTQKFVDYTISKSCNEHDSLSTQVNKLQTNDLIIADRNYGKYVLMKKLYSKVGFLFRISKNMNIYKDFIASTDTTTIIQHNGMNLKLIKYAINKSTRKAVTTYFSNKGEPKEEDKCGIYVLCTNRLTLTEEQCITYYKQRWRIETAFKSLKSNFDVRNPLRVNNCKNPIQHVQYTLGLSFMMYNMARELKNKHDKVSDKSCRLSKCFAEIRELLIKTVLEPEMYDIVSRIQSIYLILSKHLNIICLTTKGKRNHKVGRYKSMKTIENNNKIVQ